MQENQEIIEENVVPDTPEDAQVEADLNEWESALRTAVAQRDEYLDLAQRLKADFENYKRRNATARTEGVDDGMREVLMAMLPVLDNLERALEHAEDEPNDAFIEGVRMTHKQLIDALKRFGVEEVPALNEPFDPEIHHAVLKGDSSEGEPGTICMVLQTGYRMKEKMLRYAMVKVISE